MKVLVLGINGFIGHHLARAILERTGWSVTGMDINDDRIKELTQNERFRFIEGDITINREYLEYNIKKHDVIIPLVAVATPSVYVSDPLRVFELDFEANLPIVRSCVKYSKRLIFPSTSEVYGMSEDESFDVDKTNLVLGPVHMQRWIYSCSKQLMDRVIYAYGIRDNFDYTLFRPFNWFGTGLDNILEPKEGASRVITQFLGNIVRGSDLILVDGGRQKRAFTHISDGIDALIRIIENRGGVATRKIYNVGNPANDHSISHLGQLMVRIAKNYPEYPQRSEIITRAANDYYGKGYEDVKNRVPDISNTMNDLGWTPQVSLEKGLEDTIGYYSKYLRHARDLVRVEDGQ
jgi:nucleoside-diphosphate-sugar epimerase